MGGNDSKESGYSREGAAQDEPRRSSRLLSLRGGPPGGTSAYTHDGENKWTIKMRGATRF